MIVEMSDRLRNDQPSVLILADFADGSWHATTFAMQFLYQGKSPISILQTYKNPGWGHFTMRKLSHSLKKITKYELQQLKSKLLSNFPLQKNHVNTLSIEGDLNTILQYKPLIKGEYFITLGIYSSFPESFKRQNKCLEELIDTTHHPLFILPEDFNKQTDKKILFVGNPDKIPSEPLIHKVLQIGKEKKATIEILFVLTRGVQKVSEEVLNFYIENFKSLDYEIKQLPSIIKSKGIKEHLSNITRDLVIIENS
jgi:hypothetical protein